MAKTILTDDISDYSEWRAELSDTIQNLSVLLKENHLTDLRTHHQFETILASLEDDNLSVAFVAEFSRGKSEMINSIFFGDYNQRVLPSGSGRTTMCPTELRYDPELPTSVRLLPIESRKDERPLFQLKKDPSVWEERVFDIEDPNGLAEAASCMTDNKLVSKGYAQELEFDLLDNKDSKIGLPVNRYDEVEIPRWRHAVINLPHPLLEMGLIILDTPGLNGIGAEPELTINQLSSAHTVVFILSNDTGVTATDLALWEQHICGIKSPNNDDLAPGVQRKLVALNKIDTLWDGIRSEDQIESEIKQQIEQTAKVLDLSEDCIFPVSAQKALLGKLNNDCQLIERSRIEDLELAIADRLIPQKKQIVIEKVETSINAVVESARSILDMRVRDADEHIAELKQLSNKNTDVISHIMQKVQAEKSSLEQDMRRYAALRAVYGKETSKLIRMLASERLEKLITVTEYNLSRCTSSLTLQKTMAKYFERLNFYIDQAINQGNEIAVLSESITREFEQEHRIANFSVRRLRLDKYKHDISRLELKYSKLRDTKTLFFREQITITSRFYDSVCISSRRIFEHALKNSNTWNNNLMVPMETYVREHHSQLRRRLESVKRIHKASDTVDMRLKELEIMKNELQDQYSAFTVLDTQLESLLSSNHDKNEQQNNSTASLENTLSWNKQAAT